MNFLEPITVLTDYLLALFTVFPAMALFRTRQKKSVVSIHSLWAAAFFFTALAAAAGGTVHGLPGQLGLTGTAILWKITLFSIGLASLCMLSATITSLQPSWSVVPLHAVSFAQFSLFISMAATQDSFRTVILYYVPVMLEILCLQIVLLVFRHEKGPGWIIAGIILSFAAAAVQQSDLSFFSLRHNDLYHLIQMGAMFLLYRGARASASDVVPSPWPVPVS